MDSALFSPIELPFSSLTSPEGRRHQEALAALSDWQEAYLSDHDLRVEFARSSKVPFDHMRTDLQLVRAVAEGAKLLGGPCSHGVELPTVSQDRYEYVLLARYVEELRLVSSKMGVALPSNVLFGSLPTGLPTAQSVRVPRTNSYLVVFNSGLFGYLYLLGRIIASCIPHKRTANNVEYSLGLADVRAGFERSDEREVSYLTPSGAAAALFELLKGMVFQGTPWASMPFRVQRDLVPLAETFVDASHAFVVGHEYAHLHNGDLDQPLVVHRSLGPADATELVDHSWKDEIYADFLGMQAAMAACGGRERPTVSSYAGACIYLHGVQMLCDTIALAVGREEGALDGQLSPPLSRRRQILRNGLEYYLSLGAAELLPRELAVADAADNVMDVLWSQCRGVIADDEMSVHALWQSLLQTDVRAASRADILSPVQTVGEIAYNLLAEYATDPSSRRLLNDVSLAVAVTVTLIRDAASPDEAKRERAVRCLCMLDADAQEIIPLIRWTVSKMAPTERLGDDPSLVPILHHFASRIRSLTC